MALWSENVAVEGKAVAGRLRHFEYTSKAVNWVHLICVVLLQDAANGHDGAHVLVCLPFSDEVKGVWISNIAIGRREVHCKLKADFATTKNVV